MTIREKNGITKAYDRAIICAANCDREEKEFKAAIQAGETVTAEIKQRQADQHRGEAYGIAQALALIGGNTSMVNAIYKALGD